MLPLFGSFLTRSPAYTYMIGDSVSKECVLIDPVDIQAERDIKAVAEAGFTLKFVINTHVHADHITGSGIIKQKVQGVRSIISKASGAKADICVEHGDEIKFGATVLKVRATPGHTPGCVTYVLDQGSLSSAIRFSFVGAVEQTFKAETPASCTIQIKVKFCRFHPPVCCTPATITLDAQ